MNTKRTIKSCIAALLLASSSAWSSDTAITQVWLNIDPSYRLRLPDTIILQNDTGLQQFNQVCVGITGVGVSGNAAYDISVSSANFDSGSHRLSDGDLNSPSYIRYQLYWNQTSQEILDTDLTGLTIPVSNATQNYADIVNDVDCTNPINLLFDMNNGDLSTATGSYSDNITITLSGN